MVPRSENAQNGATDARIGGTRDGAKIERMARHRFDHQ